MKPQIVRHLRNVEKTAAISGAETSKILAINILRERREGTLFNILV